MAPRGDEPAARTGSPGTQLARFVAIIRHRTVFSYHWIGTRRLKSMPPTEEPPARAACLDIVDVSPPRPRRRHPCPFPRRRLDPAHGPSDPRRSRRERAAGPEVTCWLPCHHDRYARSVSFIPSLGRPRIGSIGTESFTAPRHILVEMGVLFYQHHTRSGAVSFGRLLDLAPRMAILHRASKGH
jgi:hypothetical protein